MQLLEIVMLEIMSYTHQIDIEKNERIFNFRHQVTKISREGLQTSFMGEDK